MMVRNIDELRALEKVMKSLVFSQSFELIVFDSNIMTRKMLDNEFPSPPFHPPQVCTQPADIIMACRTTEKRPVIVWDLDDKSARIEDWIPKLQNLKKELEMICFISSNQMDKTRVVHLMQQGAAGFLVKPWNYEVLHERLGPILLNSKAVKS